jgi:hypothetical protein
MSTHPSGAAPGRFACVVDEHPRFHLDALRWYAALTALAGVEPSDLVVHAVGGRSSEILGFLGSQGVNIRSVERFDARSPHCNKISGALRLADDPIEGMAVLCDTDVVVCEDPRQLTLQPGTVAGKLVDAPVPALQVVLSIFLAAGLQAPPTVPLPWGPDDWTVSGNSNGGLYLVPGPLLPRLATAWAHWAVWLLDRAELLQEWTVYVDQVAMALALAAEGVGSLALDVRWNTPTHDPSRIPPDAPEPKVLHYHQEIDLQGLIRVTGIASIDSRIGEVNGAIRAVWKQAAPDSTHRHWLSMTEQEAGTRFDNEDKRKIVAALLEMLRPASVLEVGIVPSGVYEGLTTGQHVGIDTSEDAVRRARIERPDCQFLVGTLASHRTEADIVLCLDQLTHATNAAEYQDLTDLLWRSTRQALVVSGHEDPSSASDPEVRFHEPLSATLRRVAPDAEIYPVHSGHAQTTFVVLRAPEEKHPRDYVGATLAPLVSRHPDLLSLITMRLHARRTTGFYPDHAPRLWEYPVVAQLVMEHLPPESRLVDVGAGVTPLAPFLTSRGFVVDTVDPSTTIRTWPPQADWNEWDFLDYGRAGLAHQSWNCTLGELPVQPPFDGAYSVSVIEHVPASVRRALLADISARTRLGGLVVLTIDLVRGGDELWNLNLGVVVEDLDTHGTIQDVVGEGAAVGLELLRNEIVRDWGDSRVDIGLLVLRQTRATSTGRLPSQRRPLISRLRRSKR